MVREAELAKALDVECLSLNDLSADLFTRIVPGRVNQPT